MADTADARPAPPHKKPLPVHNPGCTIIDHDPEVSVWLLTGLRPRKVDEFISKNTLIESAF